MENLSLLNLVHGRKARHFYEASQRTKIMDLKSSIHPAALDLVLNSATNAAQKGQCQYSTPVPQLNDARQRLAQYKLQRDSRN